MVTVILVRHAVTAATGRRLGGRTPAPLSEEGRAQAEAVADRLAQVQLAAVYASPITRTMETAEVIARRHRMQVRLLEEVQEFDYGRWTDRPLAQLRRTKLWPTIMEAPSRVTFPEGESFRDAQGRAVEAIESLVARHPERATVVVVSHADIIKILIAHYAGIPLDLFQRLIVGPTSVSAIMVPRVGTPRILRFNDTGPMVGPRRDSAGERGPARRDRGRGGKA